MGRAKGPGGAPTIGAARTPSHTGRYGQRHSQCILLHAETALLRQRGRESRPRARVSPGREGAGANAAINMIFGSNTNAAHMSQKFQTVGAAYSAEVSAMQVEATQQVTHNDTITSRVSNQSSWTTLRNEVIKILYRTLVND